MKTERIAEGAAAADDEAERGIFMRDVPQDNRRLQRQREQQGGVNMRRAPELAQRRLDEGGEDQPRPEQRAGIFAEHGKADGEAREIDEAPARHPGEEILPHGLDGIERRKGEEHQQMVGQRRAGEAG